MIAFLDTSTLLAASDPSTSGDRRFNLLGTVVYGVKIRTPKTFLLEMGLVEESSVIPRGPQFYADQ